MNYTQKCALFGIYLAGLMMLVPVIDLIDKHLPFWLMQIMVFVCVFLLIFPIYRMNKIKDKTFDEHDKKICIRGGIFAALLIIATAACTYVVVLFGKDSLSLNKDDLAVAIYYGSILFIFVLSTAVLYQYHRLHKSERAEL
ncbi:MAG: hypothetical protein ACYTET_04505 [Planctomycetota bacterium]|jgi:hypothetical protein